MGVYDSVMAPCPGCGKLAEFQSKGGGCTLERYSLSDAPPRVLVDAGGQVRRCDCGCVFNLVFQVLAIPTRVVEGGEEEEDSY